MAVIEYHPPYLTLDLELADDSELSEFYWRSEFPVAEIAETFGYSHVNATVEAVAPALLNQACAECGERVPIVSRTHAQRVYSQIRKAEKRGEDPGLTCEACHEKSVSEQLERYARYRAEEKKERQRLRSIPYREYLQTDHWKNKRHAALRRAGYRCQTCNRSDTTLDVHHRTYERRGAERASDLTVLCRDCHGLYHGKGRLAEPTT